MNLEKIIEEVCEKKHIRVNQFKDYLNAFGKHMIEKEADRFINYCEEDGWKYWSTDIEIPTTA